MARPHCDTPLVKKKIERIFRQGYFIFKNPEPRVKGNVFYPKTWGLQMY